MEELQQNLKLVLGQLMLENVNLTTRLQLAEKKIVELEAKISEIHGTTEESTT